MQTVQTELEDPTRRHRHALPFQLHARVFVLADKYVGTWKLAQGALLLLEPPVEFPKSAAGPHGSELSVFGIGISY